MPRNKPRLQLALYARPKHPGTFHYALFLVPKAARGPITKHHVKNTLQVNDAGDATQPWRYERTVVADVTSESRLLVRMVIAKVAQPVDAVERLLGSLAIVQVNDEDEAEAQSFTCRTWVRDAFLELRKQGAIAGKLENWKEIEHKALEYVDRKREQGRWSDTWQKGSGVPLMDLLEGEEVVE